MNENEKILDNPIPSEESKTDIETNIISQIEEEEAIKESDVIIDASQALKEIEKDVLPNVIAQEIEPQLWEISEDIKKNPARKEIKNQKNSSPNADSEWNETYEQQANIGREKSSTNVETYAKNISNSAGLLWSLIKKILWNNK